MLALVRGGQETGLPLGQGACGQWLIAELNLSGDLTCFKQTGQIFKNEALVKYTGASSHFWALAFPIYTGSERCYFQSVDEKKEGMPR